MYKFEVEEYISAGSESAFRGSLIKALNDAFKKGKISENEWKIRKAKLENNYDVSASLTKE